MEPRPGLTRNLIEFVRRYKSWTTDDVELIFSGVVMFTAIVGVVGLICTFQQTTTALIETKRSNDLAIQSTKLDRRAWLGATAIGITSLEAGKKVVITTRVTNSGPTPAKNGTIVTMVRFVDSKLQCAPDWNNPKVIQATTSSSVIFSGDGTTSSVQHEEIITEARLAQMQSGNVHLCVNQRTTYIDVFDEPHETELCGFVYRRPDDNSLSVAPLGGSCNRAT